MAAIVSVPSSTGFYMPSGTWFYTRATLFMNRAGPFSNMDSPVRITPALRKSQKYGNTLDSTKGPVIATNQGEPGHGKGCLQQYAEKNIQGIISTGFHKIEKRLSYITTIS